MSLQIRINGEEMDLAPNMSTELELLNPYLTFEDVLSSKATIPALPITGKNRIILGFPEQLQNDAVGLRYECEKYYNGQLLQQGVAILTEASDSYTFQVVQALGELFGDLHTTPLSEVDFGSIALPATLLPVVQQFGRNVAAFPTILNPDYYGSNGASISYSGKVNEYTAGAYTAAGPKVPMPFLIEVVKRFFELTGVTISGSFLTHTELQKLLFYNTRALDGSSTLILSQHLPALTMPVLLLELRKMFGLAMLIDPAEKSIKLDFLGDFLGNTASKDWSEKAVKTYKKRPELNRRLLLSSVVDGGDGLAKDNPPELADYLTPALDGETGTTPISCQLSTLLTDRSAGPSTTGLAITKQLGRTAQFSQLASNFSPRLLFWNGLTAGTPVATAKSGGYSLYWTGADGLAARFWPAVEAMRKRMYYLERQMDLDEVDLATLDWSQKVHINGVDYLVARIQVTLPIKQPAQVLLVRV
ncbi:hypothetical protein [Spirosoma litoris]